MNLKLIKVKFHNEEIYFQYEIIFSKIEIDAIYTLYDKLLTNSKVSVEFSISSIDFEGIYFSKYSSTRPEDGFSTRIRLNYLEDNWISEIDKSYSVQSKIKRLAKRFSIKDALIRKGFKLHKAKNELDNINHFVNRLSLLNKDKRNINKKTISKIIDGLLTITDGNADLLKLVQEQMDKNTIKDILE